MDITGCDLITFTFASPREVFARIVISLLGRWPKCLFRDLDEMAPEKLLAEFSGDCLSKGEGWVVFYRDAVMIRHMELEGYTPMPDGDGPFAIIARFRKDVDFEMSGLTELHAANHNPGGARPPEPYRAWLCSPTLLEVTVVAPGPPDSLPFAAWLHEQVRLACRAAE